jgi:hypothetical protein
VDGLMERMVRERVEGESGSVDGELREAHLGRDHVEANGIGPAEENGPDPGVRDATRSVLARIDPGLCVRSGRDPSGATSPGLSGATCPSWACPRGHDAYACAPCPSCPSSPSWAWRRRLRLRGILVAGIKDGRD